MAVYEIEIAPPQKLVDLVPSFPPRRGVEDMPASPTNSNSSSSDDEGDDDGEEEGGFAPTKIKKTRRSRRGGYRKKQQQKKKIAALLAASSTYTTTATATTCDNHSTATTESESESSTTGRSSGSPISLRSCARRRINNNNQDTLDNQNSPMNFRVDVPAWEPSHQYSAASDDDNNNNNNDNEISSESSVVSDSSSTSEPHSPKSTTTTTTTTSSSSTTTSAVVKVVEKSSNRKPQYPRQVEVLGPPPERRDVAEERTHPFWVLSERQQQKYVALDCEMVGVGPGGQRSALARVTVIDWHGRILMDEYIRPGEHKITDYRTFVSGITPDILRRRAKMSFSTCRKRVLELLKGKILVGHGLKNDLDILRINHKWFMTRDTAQYEPFMKVRFQDGILWPRSLKDLAKELLNRDVQVYGRPHCSYEDALAALDLYRLVWQSWEKSMDYKKKNIKWAIQQQQLFQMQQIRQMRQQQYFM